VNARCAELRVAVSKSVKNVCEVDVVDKLS
jgi:hypothetical protein